MRRAMLGGLRTFALPPVGLMVTRVSELPYIIKFPLANILFVPAIEINATIQMSGSS